MLSYSFRKVRILQQLPESGFRQQANCMYVQPIAHCHSAAEASPFQRPQQVQSQHCYLLKVMLKPPSALCSTNTHQKTDPLAEMASKHQDQA